MNDKQRQTLKSIVSKCSEDELNFLVGQFDIARQTAKQEFWNGHREDEFEEVIELLAE